MMTTLLLVHPRGPVRQCPVRRYCAQDPMGLTISATAVRVAEATEVGDEDGDDRLDV